MRWTFKREAQWMLWLFLAVPLLGLLYAVVIPWLRGT